MPAGSDAVPPVFVEDERERGYNSPSSLKTTRVRLCVLRGELWARCDEQPRPGQGLVLNSAVTPRAFEREKVQVAQRRGLGPVGVSGRLKQRESGALGRL